MTFNKNIVILAALAMLIAGREAKAACSYDSSPPSFNGGVTLNAPRDNVEGALLARVQMSPDLSVICGGFDTTRGTATVVNGRLSPPFSDVFQTGIPGIGIQYYVSFGGSESYKIVPIQSLFRDIRLDFFGRTTGRAFVNFITLGPGHPIVAGTATNLPVLSLRYIGTDGRGESTLARVTGTLRVISQTCRVSNSSIVVPMPPIPSSALPSVGSTAGETNFSINLNGCTVGLNLSMTMTDAGNAGNNSNVLSLGSGSTASGVGYQVLYNSSPIRFGPDSSAVNAPNQIRLGVAAQDMFTVPLSVRYVRTGETVTPGRAEGRATFTMSYQ